jgi:hypothetical protein
VVLAAGSIWLGGLLPPRADLQRLRETL